MNSSQPAARRSLSRLSQLTRPRSLLVIAVVALGTAAAWQWRVEQQIAAARRQAWQQRQADEALYAWFEETIHVDGRALALSDFAAFLEAKSGLPVEIDATRLAEAGIAANTTIRLPVGRFTASALITHALEQCELSFDMQRGRLWITTPDRLESHDAMHLAIYPAPQPGLTASTSEDEWSNLVTTIVDPPAWDEVGGQGHIEAVPGGLAVVHTRAVQSQIAALFTRLGDMENPPRSLASVPLAPAGRSSAERRIRAALSETTSIDVINRPLEEFIADLAQEHDLQAALFHKKLEESGVSRNSPITLRLKDVSLRSVLVAVLDPLDLGFVIRNDMLLVTSWEDAELELAAIAYPVHDLVAGKAGPDFDSFIELVTCTIEPATWNDVGGPGAIVGVSRGWLIVDQTDEIHAQLEALIRNLRRVLAEGEPGPYPIGNRSPQELQIEAALEQAIELDYTDTSLADFCADLSQRLQINFVPAQRRLEEAGISIHRLITCSFPPAPLRVQLSRFCNAMELDYRIGNDMLCLSTPEDIESYQMTKIYDVRPLTDADLGLTDIDSLCELIQTHIQPQSWDEVGGPGSVMEFRELLVFTQSEEVHREVAGFLQQLETYCLDRILNDNPPQILRVQHDCVNERLELALRKTINFDFCGVPLIEAVDALAAKADVPITIDVRSLADAGIDVQTPVSFAGRGMTLNGALRQTLFLQAAYVVATDHHLLVTAEQYSSYRNEQASLFRMDDTYDPSAIDKRCEKIFDDQLGTADALGERWMLVTASPDNLRTIEDELQEERTGQQPQTAREREAMRPVVELAAQIQAAEKDIRAKSGAALSDAEFSTLIADVKVLLSGYCQLSTKYAGGGTDPPAEIDPFAAPPSPPPLPAADDPFAVP